MTDPVGENLRLSVLKLSRRIRRNRPADDISDSQLTVLMQLHAGGDLTPGRLAELEHVTPPSMNRTVNGLERAGLVTRRPAPDDARKVLVGLTAAGTALVHETRRLRSQWFSGRIAELTDDERRILDAATPLLRRLAES